MRIPAALLFAALAAAPAAAQVTTKPPTATKTPPATTKAPASIKTAKPKSPAPTKTTLSGVYTEEEAVAGKEMYAGLCANCHTAASHTGTSFKQHWVGRPLSELFEFMRTNMPKNDPGTLAAEDYGVLLAYMLQMNKMPAGKSYLSTDPAVLAKIRIDTAKTAVVRKP